VCTGVPIINGKGANRSARAVQISSLKTDKSRGTAVQIFVWKTGKSLNRPVALHKARLFRHEVGHRCPCTAVHAKDHSRPCN
jgi:hypothetical protein